MYVDVGGRDLGRYVRQAQQRVAEHVALPPGYSIAWSGQFEYLQRSTKKLTLVVPVTLAVMFILLYLPFRRLTEAALIMAAYEVYFIVILMRMIRVPVIVWPCSNNTGAGAGSESDED